MKSNENWSLMMKASKQYYQLGLSQDEIAKNLYISKSTVSRLIKKSVELGYVEFKVHSFGEADEDLQRELDRAQVRHDLRRMAWEKDFDEVSAQLESILCLLRDFLALPAESQALQLGTFRDAALEEVGKAEALLTKGREQA